MDRATQIEETFLAPVGSAIESHDTQIIERDGWYQVITPSSGTTQGNEVVLSRLAPSDVERVVDETVATYRALGLPFKWSVGPLTMPADFGSVLERRGFSSWDVRGMALDVDAWTHDTSVVVTVDLVAAETLVPYQRCWAEGWDTPIPDAASWIADHQRAIASGRFHFFLASIDGSPAGTAGLIVKPRCGYLVGGNVLAPYRNRGVYRALLGARIALARRLGVPLVVTQARERTSAPILEHLGFSSLYTSHIYKWEP